MVLRYFNYYCQHRCYFCLLVLSLLLLIVWPLSSDYHYYLFITLILLAVQHLFQKWHLYPEGEAVVVVELELAE